MTSFTKNNFQPVTQRFNLDKITIEFLKDKNPNFGFNGLGEVVFRRTYSRDNESYWPNLANFGEVLPLESMRLTIWS